MGEYRHEGFWILEWGILNVHPNRISAETRLQSLKILSQFKSVYNRPLIRMNIEKYFSPCLAPLVPEIAFLRGQKMDLQHELQEEEQRLEDQKTQG